MFFFFILGYGIFRNFGVWDIGIYFGIRVKLILRYGIIWTVYFGKCDIAYLTNQASITIGCRLVFVKKLMKRNLGELNVRDCRIYLCDIFIISSTLEQHLKRLHAILLP